MARNTSIAAADIISVGYAPQPAYQLDIEILTMAQVRKKVGLEFLANLEIIEFYLLISITEGSCRHMADFEEIPCNTHSLLFLQPGQIQCFDTTSEWQGWLVIIKPEAILPTNEFVSDGDASAVLSVAHLPVHFSVNANVKAAFDELIARMHQDSKLEHRPSDLNQLLRNQLDVLLCRLRLITDEHARNDHCASGYLKLHRRFRLAVESHFRRYHNVTDYATHLGCSVKNLSRAVTSICGITPKEFLSKRIILEAKRLLAYTDRPVGLISDHLGFKDPSYFTKFFRKKMNCTPGEFRERYLQHRGSRQ